MSTVEGVHSGIIQMLEEMAKAKGLSSDQSEQLKILKNRHEGVCMDPEADIQQLSANVNALFEAVFYCS
ncbi:MAG: hypothetical protein AAB728_05145 [Patescibacteria group bacterium]